MTLWTIICIALAVMIGLAAHRFGWRDSHFVIAVCLMSALLLWGILG